MLNKIVSYVLQIVFIVLVTCAALGVGIAIGLAIQGAGHV